MSNSLRIHIYVSCDNEYQAMWYKTIDTKLELEGLHTSTNGLQKMEESLNVHISVISYLCVQEGRGGHHVVAI